MSDEILLDVRTMPPRERHPKIFRAWEELPVGAALRLVNDHDPKPLFYEFRAERAGEFEWNPLERGPEQWVVRITRVAPALPPAPSRKREGGNAAPARPDWAAETADVLDVREDLRAGREPFQRILERAQKAGPGEVFAVRAIFEPRPLYQVLGARGFEAWAERLADDDWKAYFRRRPPTHDCTCGGGHAHVSVDRLGRLLTLDVSTLEPPEPMVRILQKVQELGPNDVLEVLHHREPVPLYAHLEKAGFSHQIEKLGEARYRLRIRRVPSSRSREEG